MICDLGLAHDARFPSWERRGVDTSPRCLILLILLILIPSASQIYGKTSDEPGGEDRLAMQIGFKHKFSGKFQVHGAIGRSVRADQEGGPALRAYLGVRFNFDAPWHQS